MSFRYKVMVAVFSLYSLVPTPTAGQEKKERPYHSPDADLEFILQKYYEKKPDKLKCGWGEPWELNEKWTVSVKEKCFGGGKPEYRIKIVRQKGKKEEIFMENLEGKMNEHPLFLSLSDKYEVQREGKKTKVFDFSEGLPKKTKKYINRRYSWVIKELKKVLERGQKKN